MLLYTGHKWNNSTCGNILNFTGFIQICPLLKKGCYEGIMRLINPVNPDITLPYILF